MNKKVVVIGGGAAGMMAAGVAGSRGIDVTLIEKNPMLGKKMLITGKGRCNITNDIDMEGFIKNTPVNGKFLYSAFYAFTNTDIIELLNEFGVKTKVERGGRVFPVSDKSKDVVDALEKYIKRNNVKVIKGEVSKVVSKDGEVSCVVLSDGQTIKCDSVIIATGGASYPATGSTGDGYKFAKENGHTIVPLKPSLVPLETMEDWVKDLQGLSLRNVSIKVLNGKNKKVYDDFGEMIFTHFGVSGPIILSASSYMKRLENENYKLVIDLKPALSDEELDKRIQNDFSKYINKIYSNSLNDLLPKKLIPVIINLSQIPHDKVVNEITRKERLELVHLLKNLTLHIKRYRPLKDAIITSGGVKVSEINPSTMESKLVKGLYFAGEVIDVDAYTGGFNLQIAFSTGYLAGLNC
ncbi:ferredoxin--NADP reductase [Alkalithermobacter paradoxus]|uniref:Ferredoxin--NADP reductase n=1 Tax=Alkalithermobacter paradoxus TaxID=29349 RepID=A0A1V4IA44_9FIRM|nr:ferredoxin--NADP reductase [[Clostridium] thermoalcaliphilum]